MGFEQAGYAVDSAFDYDQIAVDTYNANLRGVADFAQITAETDFGPRLYDVIVAGPPCQGFSTAGGYQKEDDRNNRLIDTAKIIAREKPKLAVIENVAALSNQRNRGLFESFLQVLVAAGYYVDWKIFPMNEYGVAQKRRRIIIVARNNNRPFDLADLVPVVPEQTVDEALESIPSQLSGHNLKARVPSKRNVMIAKKIKPGQKLSNVRAGENCVHTWDIPEVFGKTSRSERELLELILRRRRQLRRRSFGDADPVSKSDLEKVYASSIDNILNSLIKKEYVRKVGEYFDLKFTFNGKYRRLAPLGFAPTVDTRFGDVQLFVHPREHRGMTPREAARLQSFDDGFELPSSDRAAFRMIGNAVPPKFAKQLACSIRAMI